MIEWFYLKKKKKVLRIEMYAQHYEFCFLKKEENLRRWYITMKIIENWKLTENPSVVLRE